MIMKNLKNLFLFYVRDYPKEVEDLLSWVHNSRKEVGVIFSDTRQKKAKELLREMGFILIESQRTDGTTTGQGILGEKDIAFHVWDEKVLLLNDQDFFYIKKSCGAGEYVDGPSAKDLRFFQIWKVFGTLSCAYHELKIFAPQFKYRWQVWYFKYLLRRYIKKIYEPRYLPSWYKRTVGLTEFLRTNNPKKSRWF